jgi:hypothetical protein
MNNRFISWLFTHIFTGILIFKGLTARYLYKAFGVKWLNTIGWLLSKVIVAFRKFANASSTRALLDRYIVSSPQLVISLQRLWTYFCLIAGHALLYYTPNSIKGKR